MSDNSECARCWQPLTPETTVDLWDGKSYCRECVEKACTGLSDYARARDELWAHQYPIHREWGVWMLLGLCLTPSLLVVLVFSLMFGSLPVQFRLLVLFPVLGYCGGLMGAVLLSGYIASRRPMRVTIRNGIVRFSKKSKPDRSLDLRQCTWQTMAQRCWPMTRLFAISPGIALWPPARLRGVGFRASFALTDEEERFWAGFLTLAGIPNRHPLQFW